MKTFFLILAILMFTWMNLNTIAQIATVEHLIVEDIGGATSVGAGDLDNDGDFDFAVTASDNGQFSWFENNGNMFFTQHVIGNGFIGASTVSIRDIDHDMDSDMVVCSKSNHKVVLYKNTGFQIFTEQEISNTITGASYVYIFDLDQDSDMDILGAACGGQKIYWYENDGAENFTFHVIKENWTGANNAYPMDIDLDGDIDIVASAKSGNILWFENSGSMTFTEHTVIDNWGEPSSVVASDIDRDGDIDIAATSCGTADAVAWFENNGSLSFTQHVITTDYSGARSVIVTDFDDDNDQDIIAVAWSGSRASIFMNDGNQNFPEYVFCNTAYDLLKLVVIDFDKDNDLDIIGSCYGDHEIRWWENLISFLIPDFSVDYTSGHAPLAVQFQDLTNSKPIATSWSWDFNNDGIIESTLQNPEWIFTTPGSYDVRLLASSNSLQDDTLKVDYIRVFDGESALEFDGISGNILIPADSILSPVENITIEAWIKPVSFGQGGEGRIIDKAFIKIFTYSTGPQSNQDSCLVINIKHATGIISKFSTLSGSIQLNIWQHIALTYKAASNEAHIYINGIDQVLDYITTPVGNITNHANKNLYIGNSIISLQTFNGSIDEVRFWSINKSQIEVANDMNSYINSTSSGLVGYWRFNEGSNNIVIDESIYDHNGNITRARWIQGKNLFPVYIPVIDTNWELDFHFKISPNPAFQDVNMSFQILETSKVDIAIYNNLGIIVSQIVTNRKMDKGEHQLVIQNQLLKSGIYYCTLSINHKQVSVQKLIIIN